MAEKRYIHIRNWDRFQHYKTRPGRIPWIKDYVAQIDDDDWLALTFAQRGLLQALRLQYGAKDKAGIDQTLARHTLCTNQGDSSHFARNLEALNHAGFIVLSSSKRLDDCNESDSPEEETEIEEETEEDLDQEHLSFLPTALRPPAHENGRKEGTDFQLLDPWSELPEKGAA